MSINRRSLITFNYNRQLIIDEIDFSKQPDNEIWYTTENNIPITLPNNVTEQQFYIGQWGKQSDLQFVNSTYENGLGKIIYNKPYISMGERSFNPVKTNVLILSLPRQFKSINAYCFSFQKINEIVFLSNNKVYIHDSSLKGNTLYVQKDLSNNYNTLKKNQKLIFENVIEKTL